MKSTSEFPLKLSVHIPLGLPLAKWSGLLASKHQELLDMGRSLTVLTLSESTLTRLKDRSSFLDIETDFDLYEHGYKVCCGSFRGSPLRVKPNLLENEFVLESWY